MFSNFDCYAQHENDETEEDQFESSIQIDNSTNRDHEIDGNAQTQNAEIKNNSMANILYDDEINAKIRSLNFKQRQIFHFIHARRKEYLKHLSPKTSKIISSMHLFVTGGRGCGKSHFDQNYLPFYDKIAFVSWRKPWQVRILLLAPTTGVAAISTDGATTTNILKFNLLLLTKCQWYQANCFSWYTKY